ncbi:hypothetical protein DINM_000483 [Dirofilaria immitis]|nr:hypothetical protein [Dirofilaria immitis]
MLIGTYESQDCESFQCLEDGMRAQHDQSSNDSPISISSLLITIRSPLIYTLFEILKGSGFFNDQLSLKPTDNAEQRNSAAQSKEQKLTFLPAKLQDSLMIVNSHMPLQPAGNAEQSNLRMATKSEEIKTVQ